MLIEVEGKMDFLRKFFGVKRHLDTSYYKKDKGILGNAGGDSDDDDDDDQDYVYKDRKQEMELLDAKFGSDRDEHIPFLRDHVSPKDDCLKYLGHGAFSVVKKCYSRVYDSDIAIKIILLKDEDKNNQYLKKFLPKELDLWKELSKKEHPNLLNMIGYFSSPTCLYITMDYADKGDVLNLLLCGPITEHKARSIFRGLVAGVLFMHKLGIAHRDIKPENMLLAKRDEVKLADFSFVTRDNPVSSERCGTPGFLAPEQRDCGYYDPFKSDMWQIGLSLYYILFKTAPYTSTRKKHLLLEIEECKNKYGHVPIPGNRMLSKDAKDVLVGLLQLEVPNRWDIQNANECFWLSPISATS